MKLIDYIKVLQDNDLIVDKHLRRCDADEDILKVSYNSMDISDNTLFVCKGANFKEGYLASAIQKGSICFAYDDTCIPQESYDVSWIKVKDIRKTLAVVADAFYNKAWSAFKNIGITGTKGKTTIAYFVRAIIECFLNSQEKCKNKKIGFLSSIVTSDGMEEKTAVLTTPETFELHEFFSNMKKNKVEYSLMEVSSQALKLCRTLGVKYDVGCFTNISNDHIGDIEHKDFDDYFNSKLILLHQCDIAIINGDIDKEYLDIILGETKDCKEVITYGFTENCDVKAYDVKSTIKGLTFKALINGNTYDVKVPMIGKFNISNALAAISITSALGIPVEYAIEALSTVNVPGRMSVFVNEKRKVYGVVDFAHNKLSYEEMFRSLKELIPTAKYSIVFGCPGGKGLNRRKDCAEVVNKYADKAILTEEDAGKENAIDICEEIKEYLDQDKLEIHINTDREQAIKYALQNAVPGEVVIIAGKSADKTIKRGNAYVPIKSDLELCREYI